MQFPSYEAANEILNGYCPVYDKAREDYRAKRIGDEDFLRIRGEYNRRLKEFDEARQREAEL